MSYYVLRSISIRCMLFLWFTGQKVVHTSTLDVTHFDHLLFEGINEQIFFHGTKQQLKNAIVSQGMDFRMAHNGNFGKGVYLAEYVTKSSQFSGKYFMYSVWCSIQSPRYHITQCVWTCTNIDLMSYQPIQHWTNVDSKIIM